MITALTARSAPLTWLKSDSSLSKETYTALTAPRNCKHLMTAETQKSEITLEKYQPSFEFIQKSYINMLKY